MSSIGGTNPVTSIIVGSAAGAAARVDRPDRSREQSATSDLQAALRDPQAKGTSAAAATEMSPDRDAGGAFYDPSGEQPPSSEGDSSSEDPPTQEDVPRATAEASREDVGGSLDITG